MVYIVLLFDYTLLLFYNLLIYHSKHKVVNMVYSHNVAIDVKIADNERFEGKKVVQISTDVAIKSPNKLMEKAKQIVEAAK